jgi:hypothetical protein
VVLLRCKARSAETETSVPETVGRAHDGLIFVKMAPSRFIARSGKSSATPKVVGKGPQGPARIRFIFRPDLASRDRDDGYAASARTCPAIDNGRHTAKCIRDRRSVGRVPSPAPPGALGRCDESIDFPMKFARTGHRGNAANRKGRSAPACSLGETLPERPPAPRASRLRRFPR